MVISCSAACSTQTAPLPKTHKIQYWVYMWQRATEDSVPAWVSWHCLEFMHEKPLQSQQLSVPRKAEPQPQITALAFHMSLDNHLIWLPLVITFHGVVIGFWASMWLRSKCCYNTEMACSSLVWPVRLYSWNLWGRPVNRAYCCTSHRCSVRPFEG